MTDKDDLDGVRKELARFQERFDHLRLKANLGKMELRDKLRELGERLEPAYEDSKQRLHRLSRAGADEARVLANSLLASWDALRRTHRDLSREAEQERAAEQEGKRRR